MDKEQGNHANQDEVFTALDREKRHILISLGRLLPADLIQPRYTTDDSSDFAGNRTSLSRIAHFNHKAEVRYFRTEGDLSKREHKLIVAYGQDGRTSPESKLLMGLCGVGRRFCASS